MVDPRMYLLSAASEAFFTFVRSEVAVGLQRRRRDQAGESGIPSPSPQSDGCPVCDQFAHVAEAHTLLVKLADRSERNGSIPQGLGGTIPVARARLEQAYEGAGALAVSNPRLRAQALTVQHQVRNLAPRLSREVRAEEVRGLADEAGAIVDSSYDLAEAAFTDRMPETPEETMRHDPLFQLLQRARAEDWDADTFNRELKATLNKEPARA